MTCAGCCPADETNAARVWVWRVAGLWHLRLSAVSPLERVLVRFASSARVIKFNSPTASIALDLQCRAMLAAIGQQLVGNQLMAQSPTIVAGVVGMTVGDSPRNRSTSQV